MNKALKIRIDHWTLHVKILNFCLVLNHIDGDLGTTQRWEFLGKDFILKHNFVVMIDVGTL